MGLGKRACKPVSVILVFDSSLKEGSDYKGYMEGLYSDEGKLILDPVDQPVRFVLRQWTDAHKDFIGAQQTERSKHKAGIRCSLLSHSGYEIVTDGVATTAPPIKLENDGRLGQVVPESWLTLVNMPDRHLEHLFAAASVVSEAAPPLSQPSAPGSGQPASGSPENSGAPSTAQ